ncbi:unnamed protein product [Closterium sp. NIES-53]
MSPLPYPPSTPSLSPTWLSGTPYPLAWRNPSAECAWGKPFSAERSSSISALEISRATPPRPPAPTSRFTPSAHSASASPCSALRRTSANGISTAVRQDPGSNGSCLYFSTRGSSAIAASAAAAAASAAAAADSGDLTALIASPRLGSPLSCFDFLDPAAVPVPAESAPSRFGSSSPSVSSRSSSSSSQSSSPVLITTVTVRN